MPLREGEQGGDRPGEGRRGEEYQEGGGQHQEIPDKVLPMNYYTGGFFGFFFLMYFFQYCA